MSFSGVRGVLLTMTISNGRRNPFGLG